MKFIITESRGEKIITDYLYEMFNIGEINWRHPWEMDDDDDEYEDTYSTLFYYGSEFDDDIVFRYYDKGYFRTGTNSDKNSPILSVEDEYFNTLNGYFGNLWHEPFKKWFRENFGLEIKTIE